ncbi:MAG: RidA family protein [Thaumarchaeota archaeon]|nr:RidA family protein [Nitrososphaerota archaeon]
MIEERLKSKGIELPEPPKPAGAYVPAVKVQNFVFVAGQLPFVKGVLKYKGKLGRETNLEEGYQAARICALNALSVLKSELGTLDRVSRIVRVAGFVNSAEDFTDQPKVINGASDLLAEAFGDAGKHVRIAVGTNTLPLGAAVEVEILAEIKG